MEPMEERRKRRKRKKKVNELTVIPVAYMEKLKSSFEKENTEACINYLERSRALYIAAMEFDQTHQRCPHYFELFWSALAIIADLRSEEVANDLHNELLTKYNDVLHKKLVDMLRYSYFSNFHRDSVKANIIKFLGDTHEHANEIKEIGEESDALKSVTKYLEAAIAKTNQLSVEKYTLEMALQKAHDDQVMTVGSTVLVQ